MAWETTILEAIHVFLIVIYTDSDPFPATNVITRILCRHLARCGFEVRHLLKMRHHASILGKRCLHSERGKTFRVGCFSSFRSVLLDDESVPHPQTNKPPQNNEQTNKQPIRKTFQNCLQVIRLPESC